MNVSSISHKKLHQNSEGASITAAIIITDTNITLGEGGESLASKTKITREAMTLKLLCGHRSCQLLSFIAVYRFDS